MRYSIIAMAAAAVSVSAQTDDCNTKYDACIAAGTLEVACQCDLAACVGEDNAREREYCSSATAGLAAATTAAPAAGYGTAAPAVTSATYACNPAHEYPAGQVCTTVNGSLTLITTTGTAPAAYETTYACNPAHQYPAGQVCTTINGSLTLVTVTGTAPAAYETTYACNPAHQYPAGQVCTTISGSLTLITTTGTAPAAQQTFACNPAHQYPAGETCTEVSGTLTLVTPSVAVDVPQYYTSAATSATGYKPSANGTHPSTPVAYTGSASALGAVSGLAASIVGALAFFL